MRNIYLRWYIHIYGTLCKTVVTALYLALSFASVTYFPIFGTVYVQLIHLSKMVERTYKIGSINCFQCCHIFPLFCAYHRILSVVLYRSWGSCSSLLLCRVWYVQIIENTWLEGRIRLFAHYTTSFSSLFRILYGHWTYKLLAMCILSSVCLRLSP